MGTATHVKVRRTERPYELAKRAVRKGRIDMQVSVRLVRVVGQRGRHLFQIQTVSRSLSQVWGSCMFI